MKDCSLSYCFPSWCVPDYAGIVVTCSQVWDCDVDVLGETQVLGDDGRNNRTIWIAKKNQQTKLEKCLNKKGFGFSGGSTCILSKCPYGTSGVGYTDGDDDDDGDSDDDDDGIGTAVGFGAKGSRVLGIYIPAPKRGLLFEHIRSCTLRHIYNAAAFMHTYEA